MNLSANFDDVSDMWLDEKKKYVKVSTYSAYRFTLETRIKGHFKPVVESFETSLQDYVLQLLKDGLSLKTVKDTVVIIKMIYDYGAKLKKWPYLKMEIRYPTTEKKTEIPVLSVDNQKKLIDYLKENFSFRNFGLLVCLNTGMRIGEICSLQWKDINLSTGLIHVGKTIQRIYSFESKKTEIRIDTPKTKSSDREIPISKMLLSILKPLSKLVKPEDFILSNAKKPIEPRTFRNYFKSVLKELGIPQIRFHGLRHSFATRCVESDCDYKTLSTILGHSSIGTTMNLYVHPDNDQKKKCIEKMLKRF